jgi:hypothetical protein
MTLISAKSSLFSNQKRNKLWYSYAIISAILLKLWILGCYELYIHYSPHDGGLFIKLSHFILNGEWLGPYDYRTLIKGPVYPLFIAVTYLLRIPLLLAQQLLYSLAAIMAGYVIGQWVCQFRYRFIVFLVLLFNPFSFDYPLFYIPYRMGLYVPLVLLFFVFLVEVMHPRKNTFSYNFLWSLGLGVIFSLLWYTREESIWVVPSLAFGLFCYLLPFAKNRSSFLQRLIIVACPLIIWLGATLFLQQVNQQHYSVRTIIDVKSKGFTAAYGTLLSIKNDKPRPQIIITPEMKKQAYSVSPTLSLLYPYLDGDQKRNWQNSFFMWSLRRGAQMGGYSPTATEAEMFWQKIGDELQQGCVDKRLDCVRSKPSIRPVWYPEFNQLAMKEFWSILRLVTEFEGAGVQTEKYMSNGSGKMMWDYIHVTGETFLPSQREFITNYPKFHKEMKARHIKNIKKIYKYYEIIGPVGFWFAFLFMCWSFVRIIQTRKVPYDIYPALVLFGGILTLCVMLTFVKITVWEISRPSHSAYPLVLFFSVYMIIIAITNRQWMFNLDGQIKNQSH